jgi:sugar O-acyltransferase (sialic acid O-acetyltransferase NeuD family)
VVFAQEGELDEKDLIIIGDGGHASVLIDIIESSTEYNLIGLTSKESSKGSRYGYPILGNDNVIDLYHSRGIKNIAIGIGAYTDNSYRDLLFNKLLQKGFNIVNLIHNSSHIGRDVKFGCGAVVFPGVILNSNVTVGNNVIIATGSTVDHDTVIEDSVLISAGVTIGASTRIGKKVLIALGAKVISHVGIVESTLIGAGAVVVKDIVEVGKYFGLPAKRMN